MLKHVVLYKLIDNSDEQKKKLKEVFYSMQGKIPQLKALYAGENVIPSQRAFDFALVCEFESIEDLNNYQEHPVHQKVREYIKSVTSVSHSVDFWM